MKETNKDEFKKVEKKKQENYTKLSPAATVLISLAAALGIIVLVTVLYLIMQAI